MSQIVKASFVTLIAFLGFIGNIFLIALFSRRNQQHFKHFNALVITLASFDSLFLICAFILGALPTFVEVSPEVLDWTHPISQIALTGVIYSTIGITIERYLITCKSKSLDKYPLVAIICALIGFAIVFNIPRFFEMEVESHDLLVTGKDLRNHPIYSQVYVIWIQFIFNCLIPFTILLVLNILVLKKTLKMNQMLDLEYVSSSESRLEKSLFLAKFSLEVVFMFILCYSVRWIVMIHELYLIYAEKVENIAENIPEWVKVTHSASTVLLAFNSAVNFYLYLIMKRCIKKRDESPNSPEELQEMKTLTSTD